MTGQPIKRTPRKPTFFSNVPVSQAIPTPDAEIKPMGGFAWTEDGIRVGITAGDMEDALANLRAASDLIENQLVRLDAEGNVARG